MDTLILFLFFSLSGGFMVINYVVGRFTRIFFDEARDRSLKLIVPIAVIHVGIALIAGFAIAGPGIVAIPTIDIPWERILCGALAGACCQIMGVAHRPTRKTHQEA